MATTKSAGTKQWTVMVYLADATRRGTSAAEPALAGRGPSEE